MKTSVLACRVLLFLVWFLANSAHLLAAEPDAPASRQYAPNREIDLLHLALEVTPDFKQRTVSGQATLRFKPIAQPLTELKLDGVDLRVSAVTSTEKIMGWQATAQQVIVTFPQPLAPGHEASVTVTYSATPQKGLYFRTPEMGYPPEDTQLWTQGESVEARHWFPCLDSPNEKFTSEITCRVPEGMVVLSNGRQVSRERDAGTGLVAVRWLQDKPHVSYLISLIAGHLKGLEDKYRDIPLAFYTPASEFAWASNSFKDTGDMLAFFEQEIGLPYPWAKYYQVCVEDFTAGGMENTSITTLNDSTLHPAEFENLRSSQGLVAHELSHQWFGDLVTCKDWANVWLNEGFATYYEKLYDGHKQGRDELLYRLYLGAQQIINHPNDNQAMVRRDFRNPNEQFSFLAYTKGAWVLHMLRCQLGEDLYRRCIKTFLERHAFGNVVTEDLVKVFEELSGDSFDQFFDQYVFHAHHPELAVNYSWDERTKLAKVSVQQVQKLSADVLLFQVPLTIRFKSKSVTVNRQITVKQLSEDFSFSLPEAPEIVRINPELELLAKVAFSPPISMLYTQLADKNDMIGRLMAVEQLGSRKEVQAVAKLKAVLNGDPFYGVRVAAAQALRSIGTDAALEALLASTQQTDARARKEVVAAATSFYRESSYLAAMRVLQEERSSDIKAVALVSLGAYPKPEVRELLVTYLRSDSFRNVLADAAVEAMRKQDDPFYLTPLHECLRTNESRFTTGGFGKALEALAWLARNEEKKDAIREFLLSHTNDKKRRVQLAAIGALGTLGDSKAVAALEKFTSVNKESPEGTAAERALAALREARKPAAESAALRSAVSELQKQQRELRQEIDELKKKVEATVVKPAVTNAGAPKAPAKRPKR